MPEQASRGHHPPSPCRPPTLAWGGGGRAQLRLIFVPEPADTVEMRVRPVRLPRLLGVLVIAFAQFEDRPILGALELFRGFVLQVAFRWATRCIAVDESNRAVLLWSVVSSPRRSGLGNQLLGLMAAAFVGLLMVAFTGVIAMALAGSVLLLLGLDVRLVIGLVLAFVTVRWVMTCFRAVQAYRSEAALEAVLPSPHEHRWRIDFLAAIPARSGHGGRLLRRFLEHADRCGAEVVLHCERDLVGFYRRHGFSDFGGGQGGDQRVMLRKAVALV
jgi:GNAT superfamily N-acetyltransferase